MLLPRSNTLSRLRMLTALTAISVLVLAAPAGAAPSGYEVQRGDTLSEIAVQYGVPVRQLVRANGLSSADRIYAGTSLKVSSSGSGSSGSGAHTVARGETLSEIAKRYGVGVSTLAAANGLSDPHRIVAGGKLRLPGVSGAPASAGAQETVLHTVTAGQTLSGIASRYEVPAASIAAVNGLRNRSLIRSGTTLKIPTTGRPAPNTASRATVERLIEEKARQFGYDPNLIKAIAWQESGWNNAAVSSVGARGIMQVLPSTNRDVSEKRAGRSLNLGDPADNIEAGLQYLELLYGLTDGSADKILAGYYQGLRSVRQNGVYPSTERYIANVKALWERFEKTG